MDTRTDSRIFLGFIVLPRICLDNKEFRNDSTIIIFYFISVFPFFFVFKQVLQIFKPVFCTCKTLLRLNIGGYSFNYAFRRDIKFHIEQLFMFSRTATFPNDTLNDMPVVLRCIRHRLRHAECSNRIRTSGMRDALCLSNVQRLVSDYAARENGNSSIANESYALLSISRCRTSIAARRITRSNRIKVDFRRC